MKSRYEEIEIQVLTFVETDIVRTSPMGEVDSENGDGTKYPIPDGWLS